MTHNWDYKPIGDCFVYIKNGANISQAKDSGGIPITRIETLSNGLFNRSKMGYANILEPGKYAQNVLNDGDLLMSHINSKSYIGRTVMYEALPNEVIIHGMNLLRLVPNETTLSKFFYYFTLSHYFKSKIAKIRKDAVNQSSFSITDLKKINIPVPPLAEQQQIVAELDKINETIEDCRELLRNLDALAQSLFYEYFGKFYIDNSPHYKSLKEVFDTVTDFVAAGSFASLRENVIYQDSPNYAQLVRTMDIKSNFTKGQFVFVDKHAFDFLWRVNLDKECIILPNIGVNCGEVYHLKPSNLIYDNNVLGPNAILVRSSKYNHLFLSFALKSDDFQKQLSKITSQVAQPKFNKTNLKELKVLIPPLALQEQFAARIEQIEVQKKAVEQTIAELQTLLDSRMDYWFN